MWSDEQVNDAIQVLWNASENSDVEKVTAKDNKNEETEQYVVANGVAYTDPLYLQAFDKMLAEKKLEASGTESDRRIFRRGKACCQEHPSK